MSLAERKARRASKPPESHAMPARHDEHARDAHAQQQRERILDAARRIVLREGIDALSMRKIADAIGYSAASLYLYFEGRDEIARALGRDGLAQLLAHLAGPAQVAEARARLHALAHAYVAFGCEHAQTYALIFAAPPAPATPSKRPRARAEREGREAAPCAECVAAIAETCGAELFAPTLAQLDASFDAVVCETLAHALWATLHGVVMLCHAHATGFDREARGPLIDAALDAWFGAHASHAARAGDAARSDVIAS
ncbi:TetR/AcrR family transcriptional regulator [Paraburkholderia acidisoli]|uniref:TetR family transcriptional regulator n=1 Tax=Paraburkholderia acidisoli TaxID=2571748 RepID=A0A7Z2GHR4_9BURK|nr:TetR/AcrR family transcriptional regulator [Paraburkholderia acidisoli]QGZ61654.1 TetR family transcriptional regulator [Paraburkholderia acidisoli]